MSRGDGWLRDWYDDDSGGRLGTGFAKWHSLNGFDNNGAVNGIFPNAKVAPTPVEPDSNLIPDPGQDSLDENYASPFFFMGDFELSDLAWHSMAGWSFHGGGGSGYVSSIGTNHVLTLSQAYSSRRHNSVVVPPNADVLRFKLAQDDLEIGDVLYVGAYLGEYLISLGSFEASLLDESLNHFNVAIDQSLRGKVVEFVFTADISQSGKIYIDDIEFARNSSEIPGSTDPNLPYHDDVAPTSSVNELPIDAAGLSFEVSVAYEDSGGPNADASGVEKIEIWVSVNDNEYFWWADVTPDNPTAIYNAQSDQNLLFESVAIDYAGNRQIRDKVLDTRTRVGDFDAPVTEVATAIPDDTTGLFNIEFSGGDSGGDLGLKEFNVFVKIDGGNETLIATVPAGTADPQGQYHGSLNYQGIVDGTDHTYTFYSIGVDFVGNTELAPTDYNADVTVTKSFSPTVNPEVTAIDVQNGAKQRSYIRYLDISFNTSDSAALNLLINQNRIRLERFGFNTAVPTPGTGTNVDLSPFSLQVIGNTIRIDFGINGIGGNRNTNFGDGFYQLSFDLDGDNVFDDATKGFYRMFGDADGDGKVTRFDYLAVRRDLHKRGPNLDSDINGDGVVNMRDVGLTGREIRFSKALHANLYNYIDD